MKDQRSQDRKRLNYYVTVRHRITDQPLGRVVDITPDGIRLFSEVPVDMDRVLELTMELPQEFEGSRFLMFDATAIWCEPNLHPEFPGFFDSGLRMVNISRQDRLMIQGLIREYTFNPKTQ